VTGVTLVLALLSQFGAETLASAVRERLHGGAAFTEQLLESAWIYSVDLLFSAIGFALALAAEVKPAAVLLTLPIFGVLLFLGRDRTNRMNSVLELSEAYRGTAHLLSNVIGHDDAYTGLHTRQVADLAAQVAGRLGLSSSQQRNVEFGAMLHDVGKIAISKAIINKPGALNAQEWQIMETHTIEGQRMLDQIGGLMSEIGAVVRSSHERWDGGGYPDGLAGERIPIESRIVFCCDAFNAMTTDRPYREAMSEDAAVAELVANAGTQFDPTVVDALVECLAESEEKVPDAAGEKPLRVTESDMALDKSTIETSGAAADT
jgi:HD-GYP domain-containing protein (c-di-GMP phosphodiesterase class II)